ncbi:DUF5681 domain-containing protein [Bradyrhizobium sp. ma5]|uniref:DUF5681 domain-containing protein n=1 Tax=Bradyrhizobium sp. ma5 TaxID=3344828 RepID=UPI0035D443C2
MSKRAGTNGNVGYRNPPAGTRFKKGQSGNPLGRPKKKEFNPGRILQSIDNEAIFVNVDGKRKRKRMLKAEIHFRQLFTRAIRGDIEIARIISRLAKRYFGPEAQGAPEIEFIVVPERRELTANNLMSEVSNEHGSPIE